MEQAGTIGAYLLFWVVIVALAVGGWDLFASHVFGLPVIDWDGSLGLLLLTQAVYLPVLTMRGEQVKAVRKR